MNKDKKTWLMSGVLAPIGLLLILAAAVVPFFLHNTWWAVTAYPYVYSAGALTVLAARLLTPRSSDDRLRRLQRLEVLTGIIFCVGAAFLFFRLETMRDWLAFTLAGACLQLYTSIAIPLRESKIKK